MNEVQLIHRIRKKARFLRGVILGIGDDAAVVDVGRKRRWILKTEMIVENVHFRTSESKPEDWGRKAVNCNVSDIAAMGGVPRYALVCIGVPRKMRLRTAERIMTSIIETCRKVGVEVVGGDTTRSEKIVLSVAMVGEVLAGKVLGRDGARVDDVLFVTGPLGGSLKSNRHMNFCPRIAESHFLVKYYDIHSMIDISDGLSKDLGHLASASRVGLRLFEAAIQLHPDTRSVFGAFVDGEDYELVFSLALKEASRLMRDRRVRYRGIRFFPIGRVVPRRWGSTLVTQQGRLEAFPRYRDHHFA